MKTLVISHVSASPKLLPSRVWRTCLLLPVVCLGLAAPLRADTSSYSGATQITSLPANITTPGTYFISANLNVSLASGNCLAVSVAGVTIDLNGHTITNTAGATNTAYGIYAANQNNITVRNGTITGFYYGVLLATSNFTAASQSYGHLLENVALVKNTFCAANLQGTGCRFLRCRAVLTGGSSASTYYNFALDGTSNIVEDCDVCGKTGTASTLGISVANTTDAFILNNRISGVNVGITQLTSSTYKFRDNLTSGVTTPFSNTGTNAGNNN